MFLKGAMTALVTPFKGDVIDEESYVKLIERQIQNGIDIVVPVGTTGESATLTHDEHKHCIQIAVDTCKNSSVKVLAGAGSNATKESIDLAKFAQKIGAHAVLSVSPYYNKPTQEGLYQHYKAIAQSVDIPVMPYNVPGRTGVDIAPDTMIRIFDDIDNIYTIKEATGSMDRCVELLAKAPHLYVISGDDLINYPIMANGGKGCISVTSNLHPKAIADLIHTALDNDFKSSKKINDELYRINRLLFVESNPIPIKAALHILGVIPSLEYRLPLTKPSKELMKALEEEINRLGINY